MSTFSPSVRFAPTARLSEARSRCPAASSRRLDRIPFVSPHSARAFTVLELAAAIAVVAVLICVAIPGASRARSQSTLELCISNLLRFSNATSAYAGDFNDKIWTFSWQKDNWQSQLPPGQSIPNGSYAGSDKEAAALQAVYILRTKGGRLDMSHIGSFWIPHPFYSHLVLTDYMSGALPENVAACPEDTNRMKWQRDPVNHFDKGFWLPFQPTPVGNETKRWPYSASYQTTPASYDRSTLIDRINQHNNGASTYIMSTSSVLSAFTVADVAFPALKVQLLDDITRHLTKTPTYYAVPQGKQPYLMYDGSVRIIKAEAVDPGWIPTQPTSPNATLMSYTSFIWEPTYPTTQQVVFGRARWTRNDLAGMDIAP